MASLKREVYLILNKGLAEWLVSQMRRKMIDAGMTQDHNEARVCLRRNTPCEGSVDEDRSLPLVYGNGQENLHPVRKAYGSPQTIQDAVFNGNIPSRRWFASLYPFQVR